MASSTSIPQPKKLSLFINISFLFLLCLSLITTYLHPNNLDLPNHTKSNSISSANILSEDIKSVNGCKDLHQHADYKSRCLYVKTHTGCNPKGYIHYLKIFYCSLGKFPILGHAAVLLWLIVLFYLLGNTAANYFCSSLESLSNILKLSPTIAGVTLLSLGNGASDVFSSIVAFTKSADGDVGLNSVLGGAFFVSSIVVGVISILISPHQVSVDEASFVRDVIFFLFSLSSLLAIIVIGRINLWGALSFLAIYFVYVGTVSVSQIYKRNKNLAASKYLPVVQSFDDLADGTASIPLLGYVDDDKPVSNANLKTGLHDDQEQNYCFFYLRKLIYILELPLYLPRRLTIPVVSEERWSKPYAVISVALAPILLAALCNTQREDLSSRGKLVTYMTAVLIGLILSNLAYVTTNKCSPPKECLFPWLVGGFLMSVAWTYITAEELVGLLESYGSILGISPSILGLTVLAWGNSLNDLIANATMAVKGGTDGAQIAISGCYAGPMFNTLVGVGTSLVLSSWFEYPSPYVIPTDHSLYETIGFLMGGLLWALVILPKKGMKLDRYMGSGLVAIYLCFLFVRLARLLFF
ncbi:hypothetical protein ACFX1W_008376 [Malus domestica]